MNNKQQIIFALALAALLTGCLNDDGYPTCQTPDVDYDRSIYFENNLSRVSLYLNENEWHATTAEFGYMKCGIAQGDL